jgi:cytochrome P450
MTVATDFDLSRFTFNNPELIKDPYPLYEFMLDRHPAFHSPILGGTWMFFRYDDAKHMLSEPRLTSARADIPVRWLSSQARGEFDDMIDLFGEWLAFFDRPQHTVFRRHMNRVFESLLNDNLRPLVERIVHELLEPLRGRDEVDLMAEVAYPLPALIVCDALGIPRSQYKHMVEWSDTISHIYASSHLTLEDLRAARASTLDYVGYLEQLTREMAVEDEFAVLPRALAMETDGFRLTDRQVYSQCILLTFAGLEAARYAIGNALMALWQHPDQYALLRRDPSLVLSAVEEVLRFDNPVQFTSRVAAESFTYEDARIEEGQVVLAYVGAANRDPARFADPGRLDITRRDNRHLSLGHGPHFCIGAPMVRIQMEILLRELFTTFPEFSVVPDSDLDWNTNLGFRGFRCLPVTFH